MEHPGFFDRAGPFSLGDVASATGSQLAEGADAGLLIRDIRPLSEAGPEHVTFLDNRKYAKQLASTHAGACLIQPAFVSAVPPSTTALATPVPYVGFAKALTLFYPDSRFPKAALDSRDFISPSAQIEVGAIIEPGAVIGPEAHIGSGTRIAAGAVVGYRVYVGRDCYIGPNVTLTHALVGNRVIIHSNVSVGQDGFGFAMGREGHLKVPQIGRVIIQDDVEIGANTTVDRGALKDTIIGEGTKIDNLVQIGHNVVIGRHCVVVAQAGFAGSSELGDFVIIGGKVGVIGHVKVGSGTHIAGAANVTQSVGPGLRLGGTPARPIKQWAREIAALKRLASKRPDQSGDGKSDDGD